MLPIPRLLPLLGIALALALLAIGVQQWRLEGLREDLTATVSERDAARNLAAQLAGQLKTLAEHASANDRAQAALRDQLAGVQSSMSQRNSQIERLKHENAELRAWADAALPAPVVCLRERPELRGAAAYRAWLSARDCLHPAAQPAPDQRPAAKRD
ncbi:MAG: LysB family phage lysis regulatory protein [Gammaproteobacteria bacterium]|nr:LysB family phage lysis regulatory protein [Gammaproteobacteria bacterium]